MNLWQLKSLQFVSLIALRFPGWRRFFWKKQYNKLASWFIDELAFMNLGYAALNQSAKKVDAQELSLDLYKHAIRGDDLATKDVLEVSCGMGGAAAWFSANMPVKSYTALDLAEKNITRNQLRFQHEKLTFRVADAMSLPFDSQSFDTLINIEASHAYPSRLGFFKEAHRVLKPGSLFYYADFISWIIDHSTLKKVEKQLIQAGFEIIYQEEITANVLKARELSAQNSIMETMKHWLKPEMKKYESNLIKMAADYYFLPGTMPYNLMKKGKTKYYAFVLKKPENG